MMWVRAHATSWALTHIMPMTTTTTTTQPTMDTQFLAQGGLLETLTDHFDIENTSSIDNNWMEVEMDLTNESTMSLFQELEEVEEVKEEETTANSALLSNLISTRDPSGAGGDDLPLLPGQLYEQRHG